MKLTPAQRNRQTRREAAQQHENALAQQFGREPRPVGRVLPIEQCSDGHDIAVSCYDDVPIGVSCGSSEDRRRDVVG